MSKAFERLMQGGEKKKSKLSQLAIKTPAFDELSE